MPSFSNPFDTQTVHFLDGPWKGERPIVAKYVKEGNTINTPLFGGHDQYRIQWNPTNWHWEAVTVEHFGETADATE